MKNLILISIMTLVTVTLWIIIGGKIKAEDMNNRKTLDTPPEVSGTIDIEFLREISNN